MSPSRAETGARRCPICGRATEAAFKPFCSRRCADIDLGRWLRGGYAIPGEEKEKGETEESETEQEKP